MMTQLKPKMASDNKYMKEARAQEQASSGDDAEEMDGIDQMVEEDGLARNED
jgi:hypothetical protein